MIIHAHHVIFRGGFGALLRLRSVEGLEVHQLLLIQRGEIFAGAGAEVTPGAFDPQHGGRLAGERVFFGQFG